MCSTLAKKRLFHFTVASLFRLSIGSSLHLISCESWVVCHSNHTVLVNGPQVWIKDACTARQRHADLVIPRARRLGTGHTWSRIIVAKWGGWYIGLLTHIESRDSLVPVLLLRREKVTLSWMVCPSVPNSNAVIYQYMFFVSQYFHANCILMKILRCLSTAFTGRQYVYKYSK